MMGEASKRWTSKQRRDDAIQRDFRLKISAHEIETAEGKFLCMSAGEYTGIFAPLPVDDEAREAMAKKVQERADHYLSLPDDADLTDGEDISLAEIKESIMINVVKAH